MRININKNRGLDLTDGEIENDENKEYWLLVRVSPISTEAPSIKEDSVIKVGVCDGIARVVSDERVRNYLSRLND